MVDITFVDHVLVFDNADYRTDADGHRRQYRGDLPAGAAAWSAGNEALQFTCPCGCGAVHVAVIRKEGDGTGWWMTGTLERPTLQPSLGLHPLDGMAGDGTKYHWHGFLVDGVFKSCTRRQT